MTVCVGLAVNDCLVFAADSASTLVMTNPEKNQSSILNVYQHGDKVFNLHKGLPVVAMTCGMGNVGVNSIGTLAKELRRRMSNGDEQWKIVKESYSIQEIVAKAKKLIYDEKLASVEPRPAAPHSLEFFVGGYGSNFDKGHEVWKITVVDGSCSDPQLLIGPGSTGIQIGGQTAPLTRLLGGFDPQLGHELVAAGMAEDIVSRLTQHLADKLNAPLVWPTMPVQDAIDLASFLVDTTIKYFRFLPGADIVGGHTDVAVVTKYEGFKWIKRKHFYSPALNPLETDHA